MLTTPFDIHPTLHAILENNYQTVDDPAGRAISLFDKIPLNRTCAQAGIEPHWCSCLSWRSIAADSKISTTIASAVVERINNETESERKRCAELKLAKISKLQRLAANDQMLRFKNTKDADGFVANLVENSTVTVEEETYEITLNTIPGNAIYEALVVVKIATNKVVVNLDQVSIITLYGDLAHCIVNENYFLGKWCVCYDKIKA